MPHLSHLPLPTPHPLNDPLALADRVLSSLERQEARLEALEAAAQDHTGRLTALAQKFDDVFPTSK